jgi:hypothetical protein
MRLVILQLSCKLFVLTKHHIIPVYQPHTTQIWLPATTSFPKLKLLLKGKRFVNATFTQHTRSVNGISAAWLAPRQSDCSRMDSKSPLAASYIKAMWPTIEIFKMAEHFPDSPRKSSGGINLKAVSQKSGKYVHRLISAIPGNGLKKRTDHDLINNNNNIIILLFI